MTHTTAKKNYIFGVIFLGLIILLMQVSNAWAQPGTGLIRVDSVSGIDSLICGSATTPCKTIQHAVDIANSGDTIRLAAGIYTSSNLAVVVVDSDTNSPKSIVIEGGYSPSNWNNYDPTNNVTIIDGQNARRGLYFDARQKGGSITLRGLTFQNGLVTDNSTGAVPGGGLYCTSSGTVSLVDVLFSNNTARGNPGDITTVTGGGAAFYRCTITMQNVTFNGNQVIGGAANPRGAQALGGGLFVTDNSSLQATGVTFTNNSVTAGSGGIGYLGNTNDRADALGGGAAIQFSNATINQITATGNQITAGSGSQYGGFATGGALFFEGATATVTNGLFQNNQSNGGASPSGSGGEAEGAAIMAINKNGSDSNLTLAELIMVDNRSFGGNGAVAGRANGGAVTLIGTQTTGTNLIVADNIANAGTGANRWGGGGGIYISRGTNLTLNHATFARNKVLSTMLGQALIVLDGSVATANYSIFSDHSDHSIDFDPGDGAIIALGGSDRITLNSTLFWNNRQNIDDDGSGVVINNNPITPGDPAYVSAGSPNYNYHITTNSAARDAAAGSSTQLDVDGQVRPFGATRDVGADEFFPPLTGSSLSVTPSQISDDAGTSQNVTITLQLVNNGSDNVSGATTQKTLPSPNDPQVTFDYMGESCTAGNCSYDAGSRTVTWTGDVNVGQSVSIIVNTTVNLPTNYTATLSIPLAATLNYSIATQPFGDTLSAALLINGENVYLPLVVK